MAYDGNYIADLDETKPDGATEYPNILDNAIREVKRAVKNIDSEDLADMPSSKTGKAGQILKVNAGETAYEQFTPDSSLLSDMPSKASNALKFIRVNSGETAYELVAPNSVHLTDMPTTKTDKAGKFLRVSTDETQYELSDPTYPVHTHGGGDPIAISIVDSEESLGTGISNGEMKICYNSGNRYLWNSGSSKWKVMDGNKYDNADLPSDSTYLITTGTQVLNTTSGKLNRWDGTAWGKPGDILLLHFNPTYTSPDSTISGVTSVNDLGAHLAGIDNVLKFRNGRKNQVINGDFAVWQRGDTFSSVTNVYTSDRWTILTGGGSLTISKQTMPVADSAYFDHLPMFYLRLQKNGGSTSDNNYLSQRIENVRTLAGRQVTFSFMAKANVDTVDVRPILAQNFGTSGSSEVYHNGSIISLTTNWVKYSFTVTLGSIDGKTIDDTNCCVKVMFNCMNMANADYFCVANVQVEEGPVATDFEMVIPGIETTLCERYYQKSNGCHCRFSGDVTSGSSYSATMKFSTIMRTTPTVTLTNLTNTSFPATPGTPTVGALGFYETRTANATAGGGVFASSFVADAEL